MFSLCQRSIVLFNNNNDGDDDANVDDTGDDADDEGSDDDDRSNDDDDCSNDDGNHNIPTYHASYKTSHNTDPSTISITYHTP